jgi:hypothetical protein
MEELATQLEELSMNIEFQHNNNMPLKEEPDG